MNEKEWVEGFDAYIHGEDADANPYEVGTKEHDAWVMGWAAALTGDDR